MKEKIERLIEKRGIEVDNDLHEDLASVMEESTAQIGYQYLPGSHQHIILGTAV